MCWYYAENSSNSITYINLLDKMNALWKNINGHCPLFLFFLMYGLCFPIQTNIQTFLAYN